MSRDGYGFVAHGLSSLTIYPYDAILSETGPKHHRQTENVDKSGVFIRVPPCHGLLSPHTNHAGSMQNSFRKFANDCWQIWKVDRFFYWRKPIHQLRFSWRRRYRFHLWGIQTSWVIFFSFKSKWTSPKSQLAPSLPIAKMIFSTVFRRIRKWRHSSVLSNDAALEKVVVQEGLILSGRLLLCLQAVL